MCCVSCARCFGRYTRKYIYIYKLIEILKCVSLSLSPCCLLHHRTIQSYERMNLADALGPKSYTKGERIIKQGDLEHIQFPLCAIAILPNTRKKREINNKIFCVLSLSLSSSQFPLLYFSIFQCHMILGAHIR